ncbi:hypothetical protein MBLNU459_g0385t1 [Dothideomycetes sp. NU459]
MSTESATADHLCVLIHGLWGNPSHLGYLASTLQETFPKDRLHVLVTKSNANSFTYDGIELGGERTANEIEKTLKELEESGSKVTKLSVVGYSLGGLVARYAIGLLDSHGWFEKVQPMNFTTFATPHLGVRTPLLGAPSYLYNVLGARTLSTSGRQLFTVDKFRNTNRPLLSVLADPNSIFVRALSKFKHKVLYANIVNDRSVVYYTASISRKDPFVDLDAVKLQPLPGYQDVLLRPDEPVVPRNRKPVGRFSRFWTSFRSTLTSLPLYLLLVVLVPVGSVLFLINAGYQTVRSSQRIKLHESGQAGFGTERYRIPLLEETRSLGDRVYEHLNSTRGEEYLPTPPPEEDRKSGASGASTPSAADRPSGFAGQEKFPTLALTEEQFKMIDGLDSVGWKKYPVHITAVRHSHAAIIVRTTWRPGFGQGKVVVGHWVENFEI